MPWTAEDVDRHHKGLSDAEKRLWIAVANQQLAKDGDEGRAIREANAVVNGYRDAHAADQLPE
jgi:uncharacterized protein YdaT